MSETGLGVWKGRGHADQGDSELRVRRGWIGQWFCAGVGRWGLAAGRDTEAQGSFARARRAQPTESSSSLPPEAGLIEAMHFDLLQKCPASPWTLWVTSHLARPASPPCSGKACLSDGCNHQHLSLRLIPAVLWEEKLGAWWLVTVTTAKAAHHLPDQKSILPRN